MRKRHHSYLSLLLLTLALGSATLTTAQSGGVAVNRWVIAAGGGSATGGAFGLTGTIGQPIAGVQSGGDYTLRNGYWGVAVTPVAATPTAQTSATATSTVQPDKGKQLFLPLIQR